MITETETNTYTIQVVAEYQFRATSVEEARRMAAERVLNERALQWFDIKTV